MSHKRNDKTVGIIGGMGPQATVDLMQRIIRLTPAADDIDHIRCLVDNDPKIPSRIKALIEQRSIAQGSDAEDPGIYLAQMAKGLEASGADFLAMPCNTAHYYYQTIQEAVSIPLIHLIEIVLQYLQQHYSQCQKVGILASPAIKITALYEEVFSPTGIEIIYPDPESQELLFQIIKDIKTGNLAADVQQRYAQICDKLQTQGINTAIVACTELSFLGVHSSLQIIDACELLAEKIVSLAKTYS